MKSLLEIQSLYLGTILENINLELMRKEIITIIGPNGAGKSTLIKCILGLTEPTHGKVIKPNTTKIGYVPQRFQINNLLPINVERFLALSSNLKNINTFVHKLNIKHLLKKAMQNLSGGEMQKVLLVKALSKQPDILLLDEPMQGIDVTGQVEMYKLIEEQRQLTDCGVILVSHDLHLVVENTDKVVCLNKHICCQGTPQAISNSPEFVKMFGKEWQKAFAIYLHNHDHKHDW